MTFDTVSANRTLPGPTASVLPASTFAVGSSEWWLERLSYGLASRQRRYDLLTAYYRGTQDLQRLASQAWIEAGLNRVFPGYLSANYSRLIVNGTAQRLTILGFRLGGQVRADDEAARIWRANDMESLSEVAITESLVKGECPVLIEPNPKDSSTPIITPQDPSHVIVWKAPSDGRIRQAALKSWWDEDERRRVYVLYLPNRIERWRDRQAGQMDWWLNRLFAAEPARWERVSNEKNPLGEVPIVVIPNEPLLRGQPEAEHESALGQIDHYNRVLMDMAVTSNELAFPQRWGKGVENVDEDDEGAAPAGTRVETGQTRWVTTPAPDAEFGQFAAATIDNYVKQLEVIRAGIATTSFVPLHFLSSMASSVAPSGEAFTAAEVPLIDKCGGHQRDKGSAFRAVMRLTFTVAGDDSRAKAMAAGKTIWTDPERRTESQHVDALGKMRGLLGVPEEAVWERIPIPPEEIARWLEMRAAAGPVAAPVAPATSATTAASPITDARSAGAIHAGLQSVQGGA